jgi:(p)ppGpp synthase/HD superfamily hydrolase
MQLLKTASARSRLKRFLATQERPTFLLLGREAMNQELIRRHLAPLDTALTLLRGKGKAALTALEREDLLVEIGAGHLTPLAALQKLGVVGEETTQRRMVEADASAVVKLEGTIPMPTTFAKCCKPDLLPRSGIVGVIGRSGDVRIHRQNCKLLRAVNRERLIGAAWMSRNLTRKAAVR